MRHKFGISKQILISIMAIATTAGSSGMMRAQNLVNVATNATDPGDLADTEPSIAVNPTNPLEIVIASMSEGWGPSVSAPLWRSVDGGTTWTKIRVIPQPRSDRSGPGDLFVAFDSKGRLFLTLRDNTPHTGDQNLNYIYRQGDAIDSNFIPGIGYGDDQPQLQIDLSVGGPCSNRLYSAWLNFMGRPRSMVSTSDDQGISIATVGAGDITDFENRTSRLAIARTGQVYLVYKARQEMVDSDFERAQFRIMRSDNCGKTWNGLGPSGVSVHGPESVMTWFTKNFGNPKKGKVNRARGSDAWIATAPADGGIFVAYVNRDSSNKAQIFVARSKDQGATWVSQRVTDGNNHSGFPEIAVTNNGTIGVLYIDYDDSGKNTIFRHRFARSFDGGNSWTNKILQSMDPELLSNAYSGSIWGDYEGLTVFGNMFYGVFTGESLPGKRSNLQTDPIFFTVSGEVEVNFTDATPRSQSGPRRS